MTFDLQINLGHNGRPIFHGPVISVLLYFALKNILVFIGKVPLKLYGEKLSSYSS